MANIFRLIVCFLLSAFFSSAFALITPKPRYGLVYYGAGATFASQSEACAAAASNRGSSDPGYTGHTGVFVPPNSCRIDAYNSSGVFVQNRAGDVIYETDPMCPSNSSSNGSGGCSCYSGYVEEGGACVENNPDKNRCYMESGLGTLPGGFLVQNYRYSGNVAHGTTFCVPMDDMSSPNKGCKVTFHQSAVLEYGGGQVITEGTISMSPDSFTVDQSCTVGTGETPAEPAKETCKEGYSGTVNGVTVCIAKVPDNGVDGDSKTETVNDGTNTTETTKKTDTVCTDGKCTTTTTTTTKTTNNETGGVTTNTTTSSSTSDKDGFCKEKPESQLCKDGGGEFAGSCKDGFTCEGDAIQCAIAREQHTRSCKLFEDESPESKLYEDNKGKEGNQTDDLEGNETIDVQGRIDSSDALGAGAAGVSDLTVTVWRSTVTLPFSMINPYLAALGNVLLAVSFLLALRIVARG